MLLLAAPMLIGTFVLVLAPAVVTMAFAFVDYDALSSPRLTGLANFRQLKDDPLFWKAARNSFYVGMISVPLRIAIALAVALLLAPERLGARATRLVSYLPSVVPDLAYSLLWLWMLNPIYGPFSLALQSLGFARADWLISEWGSRLSTVLIGLLQIGELFVVILAARRELPGELYELCAMEGASPVWTFRKVTLPLLIPTLMFLAARDTAWSFQTTFVPTLVITNGGPDYATLFLPLYIYQNGFEYLRFGYASAMTIGMFVLTLLMAGAQVMVLRIWHGPSQSRGARSV